MAPPNFIQTEQDAIGDDVAVKRVRSKGQKQAQKASIISAAPGARRKLFVRTLRTCKPAMQALGLSGFAKDSACLQMFKDKLDDDELESCFKCAGVQDETTQRLLALFGKAQEDIANDVKHALLRAMKQFARLLFVFIIILSIVALILYLGQLGWLDGKCSIRDFANRTCHHGTKCFLEVRVVVADQVLTVYNYALPVMSNAHTQGTGILLFHPDGPFRCCNEEWKLGKGTPDLNLNRLGAGVGSGVRCCALWDPVGGVFCDNLGSLPQYADCPQGFWECAVTLKEDINGKFEVAQMKIKSASLYSSVLFAAVALAVVEVILLSLRLLLIKSKFALAVSTALSLRCMNLLGACCKPFKNAESEETELEDAEEELDVPQEQEELDADATPKPKAHAKKQRKSPSLPQQVDDPDLSVDESKAAVETDADNKSETSEPPSTTNEIGKTVKLPATAVTAPIREPTPDSRPPTRNISDLFRPIISPPVKTRPSKSKKHGWDATASSFGFASDDASGLSGRTGFASTFTAGFGVDSGRNFAAATYSGGFGKASVHVQPQTRPISATVSGRTGGKRTRGAARTDAWSPQPGAAGNGSKGVQSAPRSTNAGAG
eukprot:TRINITY_DN30474_c0_g1_i1.p1 TRINITY_DN30474_c0_g1~~TRINITY_DN30474_c0_g1_i1.p1  ORF type:complete len:605 (-),score=82.59 TRINITY_DN30474_c0_g1_i1:20-1834(-)